jgi:hypothetical protein
MILRTNIYFRLKFIMAASMNMRAFWNVALCSLVEVDRCFGCAYCFNHDGNVDE